MSLSKLYTRAALRSYIRELSKEVSEDKVQDPAVNGIIDMNTLDLCEMLNGATQPDYGATAILSEAATNYATVVAASGNYVEATKILTDVAHGLTSADAGKRILVYQEIDTDSPVSNVMYFNVIESVPSEDTIKLQYSMGGSFAINIYYSVLSRHASPTLDLSSLKLDKIIKLVDSTYGLVPLKTAFDIENIINLSHNASTGVYGYHEGELIYLVKGSSISWGTLTLHYYRLPTLPAADTDYIDVKDKYIRLLVDKCVIDIFALASLNAPSQAVQSVENRTQAIRNLNQAKEESLRTKQR